MFTTKDPRLTMVDMKLYFINSILTATTKYFIHTSQGDLSSDMIGSLNLDQTFLTETFLKVGFLN